jgi:hypothetical protein
MGSTRGKGQGRGPGPPSEEQDKQLISNSGGRETSMGELGRQQDESNVASKPIMHRVHSIVNEWQLFYMYIVAMSNVNVAWHLTADYLFQGNKSYGSKKPFAFILWWALGSRRAHIQLLPNSNWCDSPFKGSSQIKLNTYFTDNVDFVRLSLSRRFEGSVPRSANAYLPP